MILLAITACSQQPSSVAAPATTATADTHAADEAAIRETAQRYGKAIATRDADAIQAFYMDDAWLFPPKAAIAKSAVERRAYWATQPVIAGGKDTVGVTGRVELAKSGDLAVEFGSFFQVSTDRTGNAVFTPHKYVTTWRRQPDGSWKVAADMWNTDQ